MSTILPRGAIVTDISAKLGIKFSRGGIPYDPYEVTKCIITYPDSVQREYTSVVQEGSGNYYVTAPASHVTPTGLAVDTWYFKATSNTPTQSVDQDFFIGQATQILTDIAIQINFLRMVLGDNNPMRYRRNPHMDGVSQYATTPNLDPYGVAYKWSDPELEQYLTLALSYMNNTYGMTKGWAITDIPNQFLLVRGAEILAIRAKGNVEVNESFDLSDGGATLTLNRYAQWHSQADQLETNWREEVKMWKMKFRPDPIGTATASGPYLLGGVANTVAEYLSFYNYGGLRQML